MVGAGCWGGLAMAATNWPSTAGLARRAGPRACRGADARDDGLPTPLAHHPERESEAEEMDHVGLDARQDDERGHRGGVPAAPLELQERDHAREHQHG
jgi:hypothetical protein